MNRYKIARTAWFAVLLLSFSSLAAAAANVTIYPAPDKSVLSADYTVQVEGRDVPVYDLKVAPRDVSLRNSAMDDKLNTARYFEKAAFTYFDTEGGVDVSVTYTQNITSARLLPTSAGVSVAVSGRTARFSLKSTGNFTLEVNNQLVQTLHIFANPIESGAPSPKDPNVLLLAPGAHKGSSLTVPPGKTILYFAPGMHTIDNLVVHDGQTVYIAGGAIVRAVVSSTEPFSKIKASNGTQEVHLYKEPAIKLAGSNIKLLGRGIIDGSLTLDKYLLRIQGEDISLDGVILQDAGIWNMPIWYSNQVSVTNLKLLGYRANTDGMDIISSQNVTIEGCFIRTLDDDISIKTITRDPNAKTEADNVKNVVIRGTVFWGEVAHALTIGTQVEADVNTVSFQDDDIIHFLGRTPPLGIDLSGSGTVGNVRFENIRLDTAGNPYEKGTFSDLIELDIVKNQVWQRPADLARPLGKMRGVLFKNIQVTTSRTSSKVRIQLKGADDTSNIQDVKFQNVTVNGRPLSPSNTVIVQKFASQITGLP